jgi:hypothetical protein
MILRRWFGLDGFMDRYVYNVANTHGLQIYSKLIGAGFIDPVCQVTFWACAHAVE